MDDNKAKKNGDSGENPDNSIDYNDDLEGIPDSKAGKKTWRNKSVSENWKSFRKYVTVEPLLACYLMPGILGRLTVQNLNLEKACRVNLNYSEELCNNISQQLLHNSTEEAEVHKIVAYMEAWRMPVYSIIPLLMILFIGAWSDRTRRRKPCLMFPIVGEIITSVGLIMCTYYFLEWSIEVAGVIEAVPPALTGGAATMFLGIYSYLADVTTPEERTFRIGVLNTFVSLASPIGFALSGILLKAVGFYGIFLISLCFHLTALIYGYFGIHDKTECCDENCPDSESPQRKDDDKCGFVEFFDLRHVYNTFYTIVKKRQGSKRRQTILLVLAYIFLCGAVHGASGYQYLYARLSYHFDEVDFSIFGAFSIVTNLIGIMFAVTVFSKYYKMSDYMLGALACGVKVLASFVYTFAPNKYWFYLGPVVELFGGAASIAIRSVITKVVQPDEVGKINSIMGLIETAVNVVYGPIFSAFYALTVGVFPGAFCLLSAVCTLPTVGILIYLYKLERVDRKEDTIYYENKEMDGMDETDETSRKDE